MPGDDPHRGSAGKDGDEAWPEPAVPTFRQGRHRGTASGTGFGGESRDDAAIQTRRVDAATQPQRGGGHGDGWLQPAHRGRHAEDRAPRPGLDPNHRLGHATLGAGWVNGDVAALDNAIHPAACLRTGPAVARGPGAIMATALVDLGRIADLAYFAENTLVSATKTDDLCPDALAAMGIDAPPRDATMLSLRGSLTGRPVSGPRDPETGPGPAGSDLRQRVMADLWCGGGVVLDGWILHDSGALAQACGQHPADWARTRLRAAGGPDRLPPPLTPDTDPDGPYVARSPGSRRCDWGDALTDRLRRIMDGDLATLDRGSDPACAHTLPGGVTGLGPAPARTFWAGLRAALPSAAFRIEHRHGAAPPHEAPQAAVRWSLYGRHDGPGRFGQPTGCFLHVAGMTHAEFGPRGVRREWTVIDDCAVWTQIVMATGHA